MSTAQKPLALPPRLRSFIACMSVLVWLAFYIWAVIAIGEWLPRNPWIDLIYYGIAGTAWGLPLYPLFKWSGGGRPG